MKIINTILASMLLTTSVYANESFSPPIYETAQQVRKKEKEEQEQNLKSIKPDLERQLSTPEFKEVEPVEYLFRNLLTVFGVKANSPLSDFAVRQLERKLIREAESRSNYFGEIKLKVEKPVIASTISSKNVREVKEVGYNYTSSFGLNFKPFKNVGFEIRLQGSADLFKPDATPKIKSELAIDNYLEIYGELGRTFTLKEVEEPKYEVGFNLNFINLVERLGREKRAEKKENEVRKESIEILPRLRSK